MGSKCVRERWLLGGWGGVVGSGGCGGWDQGWRGFASQNNQSFCSHHHYLLVDAVKQLVELLHGLEPELDIVLEAANGIGKAVSRCWN